MPYSIVKTFRFEAAHRLVGHKGKCRFLHGHSYQVLVRVESDALDDLGMVMDFGDLRPLQVWIDLYLDHNTILWEEDEKIIELLHEDTPERKPYVCSQNPTAEHLAYLIYGEAQKIAKEHHESLEVTSVTVFETQTSCATYTPDKESTKCQPSSKK